MRPARTARRLLLGALIAHLALGAIQTSAKRAFTHDEAIAYLAATAHQQTYASHVQGPSARSATWRPAEDWQRYMRVEQRFAFGQIRRDLTVHDIHPPLYFWLLHLACVVAGTSLWLGALLNLLLDVGALWLVYRLARFVLGDPVPAAWAALLWAVSPAVLHTTGVARPYALLGLTVTAMVLRGLRVVHAEDAVEPRSVVGLAVVSLAAVLTHYHAAIPAAGLLGLALCRSAARRRWRTSPVPVALLLAAVAFVAIHPRFWESVVRQQRQAASPESLPFSTSLVQVVRAASYMVTLDEPAGLAVGSALAVGLVVWGVRSVRRRSSWPDRWPATSRLRSLAQITAWTGAAIIALYVSGLSPPHALAPEYLSMLYPLLAVLIVGALCHLRWPLAVLAAGMLASAGWHLLGEVQHVPTTNRAIAHADRVLIDTRARGVLLPVVWQLRPDTPVYAADGAQLAEQPAPWRDRLTANSVWINARHGNASTLQQQLRRLIETRFHVESIGSRSHATVFGVRGMREAAPAPQPGS